MARSVSSNKVKAAFLAGNMTCMFVVLIGALFVGDRIGFTRFAAIFQTVVLRQYQSPIECPDGVLAELTEIRAVIENAGNPTNAREHDSVIVEPDEDFVYRLRAGAAVEGYVLKPTDGFNIDPPVLYMDAKSELSATARRWVEEQSRYRFLYTTTADGMRTTLPVIGAPQRCLLVGDSVCFGVGVDDENTIASMLQRELSSRVTVINAGVGGYAGCQASRMAEKLSSQADFESLVYIACDNDFDCETPSEVMRRFSHIKDRFRRGVCVLYTPYLEYVQGDFIYGRNGSDNWNERGDRRRHECRTACKDAGLAFIDLTDHIRLYQLQKQTVFAGLDLYADHCHFSVDGNRLAAKVLAANFLLCEEQKVTQK